MVIIGDMGRILFIIFTVGILEKFYRGMNVGLTTSLFKSGNSPPYAFSNPDISDTHPTSLPFYSVLSSLYQAVLCHLPHTHAMVLLSPHHGSMALSCCPVCMCVLQAYSLSLVCTFGTISGYTTVYL